MQQNLGIANPATSRPFSWGASWSFNLILALGRHKLRMFVIVFVAGTAAAAVSLLLPSIYLANTRILLPQQTPSIVSAFAGSSLAGLAGGTRDISAVLKNPADVYVAMLQSRTVADAIIDHFNLMNVYHSRRRMDCRKTLSGNVVITSDKGGVISISVYDKDPKRAADIANGFVTELSQVSERLAVTEAKQRRVFFEDKLRGEREALVQAEAKMEDTQEASKFIAPDKQTGAVMQGIGQLREAISEKEVELRSIQTYATGRNASVVRLEAEISGLRDQLADYERRGVDNQGPNSIDSLPRANMDFLRNARELKYHESVMEILLRQYEAARLDESRDGTLIQVLDVAVPPEFRVRPVRRLIVAVVCIVALMFSILWTIAEDALKKIQANPELSQKMNILLVSWFGRYSFRRRTRVAEGIPQ